jgi:hypothetical protein
MIGRRIVFNELITYVQGDDSSAPIKGSRLISHLLSIFRLFSFCSKTLLSSSNSMATMGGFDMGFGNIPSNAVAAFGSIAMDGDEYVRCTRCSYGGCDVRVSLCGCTLHAVSLRAPSTNLL